MQDNNNANSIKKNTWVIKQYKSILCGLKKKSVAKNKGTNMATTQTHGDVIQKEGTKVQ